jgi:signal transduction histidine kinase
MSTPRKGQYPETGLPRLLAYVAELELEVDRLRRHQRLIHQEARSALARIRQQCDAPPPADSAAAALAPIAADAHHLIAVLDDLRDPPGYHPAHDQVIALAVRPLAEQVFRWQQRLQGAPGAQLRLDLETDNVEWFPVRLRHILDNLIGNALKYRDPAKAETWVRLGLRADADAYALQVADNGLGLPAGVREAVFDLFSRAAPARAAGLGVGLAVVKMLVEQSGGSLEVTTGEGQGTTFVALLPRYPVEDFLL